MSDFIVPRSVSRLEKELEELEKLATQSETSLEPEQQEEEPEELQEVATETPPVDKEEETFKKRYSDLRRHTQKVSDDLKKALSRIEELEKQKTSPGLPTIEEAEAWTKENPKAAAIIQALADKQTSSTREELQSIKQQLTRTEQEARIRKAHPDFEDITSEDEFHDWAETQPESVQKLIYSEAADDVIWAISQYKREKKTEVPNPKKEAAKAVASRTTSVEPKTEGKGRFTESMLSKMSMQEYEKNEAAIQESIKNGTFIYDLSGAAR